MKHIGLFEGIGGFSLAARWMNWRTVAWCEWNPFCQKVLSHHFPNAKQHGDICKTDFTIYRGLCDVLTGGFPCQPYSVAGKRKGKEDERHLWPQMLRAIREISPRYVVGENVGGIVSWNGGLVFDEVQADLEAEGYEILPFLLPACGVGAPHRRDRVWFIAHRNGAGFQKERPKQQATGIAGVGIRWAASNTDSINGLAGTGRQDGPEAGNNSGTYAHTCHKRLQRRKDNGSIGSIGSKRNEQPAGLLQSAWEEFPTQSPLCGGDDGLPRKLDGITFSKWRQESIKAYGNAIVPQVAIQIFKAIRQYEQQLFKP